MGRGNMTPLGKMSKKGLGKIGLNHFSINEVLLELDERPVQMYQIDLF